MPFSFQDAVKMWKLKKILLLSLCLSLILSSVSLVHAFTVRECVAFALGNIGKPPKKGPQKKGFIPTQPGNPSSPGTGGPGIAPPGPDKPTTQGNGRSVPGGPTRRSGGSGAFTRPFWNDPSLITHWEEWWLRNQHQFLNFPSEKSDFQIAGTAPVFTNQAPRIDVEELRTRSLEVFRPYLDHKSARLREAALISLGIMNDGDSLSKIIELLNDNNQMVRQSAIISLGLLDNTRARYTLLNLVENTSKGIRKAEHDALPSDIQSIAMVLLALNRPDVARPILKEISNNRSKALGIRALSLVGLGVTGKEESVEVLEDFIKNKRNNYQLLSTAVSSLGNTGEACALPLISNRLKSKYPAVQQSAALSLGHCAPKDDPHAISLLYRCYKNTRERTLRGFTLVSMGRIGGSPAVQSLKKVYKNSASLDRPWICMGLGIAAHDTDSIWAETTLLHELKESSNRSTQKAAAVALGLSGCETAADELIRILENGDDHYLRGYCALSLGMIRAPSALPLLRKTLLEENVPQVNTQSAMALGLMNDRISIPNLLDLLIKTKNETTKLSASRSLVYLGNLYVAERLLSHLASKNTDEITSVYCMELISKLITGNKVSRLKQVSSYSNYACEFPIMTYLFDLEV